MQAVPGTRRKKLCGHEDHAQCTIRCFATSEEVEGMLVHYTADLRGGFYEITIESKG